VGIQEPFDTLPHFGIVATGSIKICGTFRRRRQFQRIAEDITQVGFGSVHDFTSTISFEKQCEFSGRKGPLKI
jgi:hypothetical protein